MRTSEKELNELIERLNRALGRPETPVGKGKQGNRFNVGCLHKDQTYGGQRLVEAVSQGGAVRDVGPITIMSKGQLASHIRFALEILRLRAESSEEATE